MLISRAEAKGIGAKCYYTGKPCPKGHDCGRCVRTKSCLECQKSQRSKWASGNPLRSASTRKWQRANPDAFRAIVNARRARKAGAEGRYSAADIRAIREKQGGKCARCGSTSRLEVDHIIPLARGGSNWPSNLQILCKPCNSAKGARL